MIIDSHCHLHDHKFSADLEDVLTRAKEANISHFVSIGCDIPTTTSAKELAQKFDQIYFSAGFHPHEAKFANSHSLAELKILAQDKKCVAIGECGLDFYYNHSNQDEQRDAFIKQIHLAYDLKLPIIIHLRDAHADCVKILKEHKKSEQKTVIHCFSGSLDEAFEFVALGCFISISGIITFKKPGALLDVAKSIPLENLLVETDSPYLAPHPFRGSRNEPSFIAKTLNIVAESRKENLADVEQAIFENTKNFFSF